MIALSGATGYVGGRLLEVLESRGYDLRCIARKPEYLRTRVAQSTTVVAGDFLDPASLHGTLDGVRVAFYLVHSMGSSGDFERQDVEAARNFAAEARRAGVERIVYLGGLGDESSDLSKHLRSRHETGDVLRASGVPVIELRASIVLGSGSLSFELLRALVERLPVMLCPRWVRTPAQPIAIEDVIDYLVAAIDLPLDGSRTFEIGGTDRVSYADIMQEYARQRGLRRVLLNVPVLTPRLSSLWLGLTTPLYARVGRKLVESLRNPTVVRDDAALTAFPIRPMGLRKAIERALANEDRAFAATRWSDAVSSVGAVRTYAGVRLGSRLVDDRTICVDRPPALAFAPIRAIGGERGWYYGDWLWRLRGALDLLAGGPGMRRGRRHPTEVRIGDALDFWRVEDFVPDRRLRLVAEMKLPGRAWLEFVVEPSGTGSVIRQTAIFDPAGLLGLAYWYAVYPLHARVFEGMLRGIAAASDDRSSSPRARRAAAGRISS